MADQHHGLDRVGNAPQPPEQCGCVRGVEVALDQNGGRAQGRLDPLERLARPSRRGAQDELRLDAVVAQVAGDRLRRAAAAAGEWAIVVGEAGVLPARLRVAQEVEVLHRALRRRSVNAFARSSRFARVRRRVSMPLRRLSVSVNGVPRALHRRHDGRCSAAERALHSAAPALLDRLVDDRQADVLPPAHLRQLPPRRAAPLAAGHRRGDGPHRRSPRAHVIAEYRGQGDIDAETLIKRVRGVSKTPQDRPRPDYQQLELSKPTGGLEPPTPSLRALPWCPWWAFAASTCRN